MDANKVKMAAKSNLFHLNIERCRKCK